jgi:hypothetical protein
MTRTAEALQIDLLRQQLHQEKIARRQAEQKLGGYRSALVKLQAQLAKHKAENAARKAEQHVADAAAPRRIVLRDG